MLNKHDKEQIEWLRDRYNYLLDLSFGKEHFKLYEATKQLLIKTDAERTELYLIELSRTNMAKVPAKNKH